MILEAIFNGEIYPAETVVPKSEKFREAGQAIADIMRYFEQTLSKEDYAKLDKLNDNFADCQTMQTEEHFKYGFTMGVLLMKEIYELPDFMKPIRQTACDNVCSEVLPTRWTFYPLTEAATVDFCLSWYTLKMQRFTFWKMKPHPERSLI